jgi:hypothetical protein
MKNVTIKKLDDGVIEVKILTLGITTYAKDIDDVVIAVDEAIESLKIQAKREGCVETSQLITTFLEREYWTMFDSYKE